MAKVSPYHSTKQTDRPVHHDNDKCTEGNNIEKRYLAKGTAGRPKCTRCQGLG